MNYYLRITLTAAIYIFIGWEALFNDSLAAYILITLYCFISGYVYNRNEYLKEILIPNMKWYNRIMYKQDSEPERIKIRNARILTVLGVVMVACCILMIWSIDG